MHEVHVIYHYSKDLFESLCVRSDMAWHRFIDYDEIEIKLDGITIKRGNLDDNRMNDFLDGFLFAMGKVLTFYSRKDSYVADLDY